MNIPQYKIHGDERRVLKKELSFLRSFVKDFWYDHQMDKDMSSFYGGSDTLMDDEKAKTMFDEYEEKIKVLEDTLSVPYISISR